MSQSKTFGPHQLYMDVVNLQGMSLLNNKIVPILDSGSCVPRIFYADEKQSEEAME